MSVDKLIKELEDEAEHYDHAAGEVLITPNPLKTREIAAELKKLRDELEIERMRLAGCGVAALGYFDGCAEEYKSASLNDVLRLWDLSKKLQEERDKLVECVRKYANKENWHYGSTNGDCKTGNKAHCHNVFLFEGDCEPMDFTIVETDVFSGCLARQTLKDIGESE